MEHIQPKLPTHHHVGHCAIGSLPCGGDRRKDRQQNEFTQWTHTCLLRLTLWKHALVSIRSSLYPTTTTVVVAEAGVHVDLLWILPLLDWVTVQALMVSPQISPGLSMLDDGGCKAEQRPIDIQKRLTA